MKKLLLIMLALALMTSFAACSSGDDASGSASAGASDAGDVADDAAELTIVDQIKADGKLVIGTEAQYPPFEFKDKDANYVGCDIWLAERIAEELGVELEIVDMAFDGIIPAVEAQQVDIGIAAFTHTEERAKVIDFTDIYQTNEQLVLIHKDNYDVYGPESTFAGEQVGSQKGTVQSQLVLKAFPDAELFELAKYPELVLEVANKNIAGLVIDEEVGLSFIESNEDIVAANFQFDPEDGLFGKACILHQDYDALTEVANKVIAEVLADGSFEQAYADAVELANSLSS